MRAEHLDKTLKDIENLEKDGATELAAWQFSNGNYQRGAEIFQAMLARLFEEKNNAKKD